MDVVCPGCGGRYHETTRHFDPDKPAHGKMFRVKSKYGLGGYNWSTFPADPAVRFADLECPWCGSCYVNGSGRVRKLVMTDEEEFEALRQEELQEEFSFKPFESLMEGAFEQEQQENQAKKAGSQKKEKQFDAKDQGKIKVER